MFEIGRWDVSHTYSVIGQLSTDLDDEWEVMNKRNINHWDVSAQRAQGTGQYRWVVAEISLTDVTWNKNMRFSLFQRTVDGLLQKSKEGFFSAKFREGLQICLRKRCYTRPSPLNSKTLWKNIFRPGCWTQEPLCLVAVPIRTVSRHRFNSSRIDFQDRSAPA